MPRLPRANGISTTSVPAIASRTARPIGAPRLPTCSSPQSGVSDVERRFKAVIADLHGAENVAAREPVVGPFAEMNHGQLAAVLAERHAERVQRLAAILVRFHESAEQTDHGVRGLADEFCDGYLLRRHG